MLLYLNEFFIFAFLGWLIDSFYCSAMKQKIVFSGYFKNVPLCPVYGFGGVLLLNGFLVFSDLQPWQVIGLMTLIVIIFEYLSGRFCEWMLGERLWDYRNEWLHLSGYISIWHSFLWLMAVSVLYSLLSRHLKQILFLLEPKISLSITQELGVYLILAFLTLILLAKNKQRRLFVKNL